MRHLSWLLILLMLALTGCPRLPGLGQVETAPLNGTVAWGSDYAVQATSAEVANGATVSLIDPYTGATVVTTLTKPDGSFSLNLKNVSFASDRPYLLEALKGLAAGGAPNRAGAPEARIRTLISLVNGSWTSLSGPVIRINPATTALCIVSGFRGLTLVQQQALMATLPPATGAFAGNADLPAVDFTSVEALVNASLLLDQDPVHVIARNTLNGTYVRMERGPFITNVSAKRATPGTTIILYGTGVDALVANNLISFNGTPASSMSLVPGGIAVTVPAGASTGPLTLRVGNLETVAVTTFLPVLPMTTIQTLAGTRAPAPGSLGTSWGIFPDMNTVDRNGNCYVWDGQSLQLYRIASPSLGISLFAGSGGNGYAGDNGPAVNAKINGVGAMTTDAAGNVYVADTNNFRVRKIDATTGIITTVVGNGTQGNPAEGATANAAPLWGPQGLALDSAGNLFILDNKRIRKVTPGGLISTYAGGTADTTSDGVPATTVGFDDPRALAIDGAGNLFVAQYYTTKPLRKIDPGGVITTIAGAAQSLRVAADAAGNVYYCTNNTVRRITPGGANTIVAGINGLYGYTGDNGPATSARLGATFYGLACTPGGAVFLSDTNNWRVRKVEGGVITTVAGTGSRFSGDGGQALAAQFANPAGMAYDSAGNLYVGDSGAYRVRKISPSGIITTVAGNGTIGTSGNGGPAVNAQLSQQISDLAVDKFDNLYILDKYNDRIVRKVDTNGIITHFAGGGALLGDNGPAATAKLSDPEGLACDAVGNLYIADYAAGRVRKVAADTGIITTVAAVPSPTDMAVDAAGNLYISGFHYYVRKLTAATGVLSILAGNGFSGDTGDGGLALNARLDYQNGVAVDSAGNVYISTSGRIRMVDAGTGIIRTVAGTTVSGYNGDGTPATGIQLFYPGKLLMDTNNQLVFSDMSNYMVRRLQ